MIYGVNKIPVTDAKCKNSLYSAEDDCLQTTLGNQQHLNSSKPKQRVWVNGYEIRAVETFDNPFELVPIYLPWIPLLLCLI